MRRTRSTITLLAILALCTPGTATAQPAEPTLTISGTSVAEGAAILPFGVYLSEPSATVVTFDYVTVDDTATAGSDYSAVSGTYQIPLASRSGRFRSTSSSTRSMSPMNASRWSSPR